MDLKKDDQLKSVPLSQKSLTKPFGVLIGSPLPRTVRGAVVDFYFGIQRKLLVLSHFPLPIIDQR